MSTDIDLIDCNEAVNNCVYVHAFLGECVYNYVYLIMIEYKCVFVTACVRACVCDYV